MTLQSPGQHARRYATTECNNVLGLILQQSRYTKVQQSIQSDSEQSTVAGKMLYHKQFQRNGQPSHHWSSCYSSVQLLIASLNIWSPCFRKKKRFSYVDPLKAKLLKIWYIYTCLLFYMLRTSIDSMKENGFKLAKERSRRYPAQTIMNADYADDLALLANTLIQAESLLHCLKRAAISIGLHVNADKTEYMCFNQRGVISTLKGSPLKLVDKFASLGSSVSSTVSSAHD